MRFDLENLPSDTALLHDLVRDMAAAVAQQNGEIVAHRRHRGSRMPGFQANGR